MNRLARYLLPIAAVAMLGACDMKESFAKADSEVTQFHAHLDAGQYRTIWSQGGARLHGNTTQAAFERLLGAVHTKLGAVKASKQVGWNVNAGTGGSTVTVTMQTTFQKGAGTEQFVFEKDKNDVLLLADYSIQSQDMMLN